MPALYNCLCSGYPLLHQGTATTQIHHLHLIRNEESFGATPLSEQEKPYWKAQFVSYPINKKTGFSNQLHSRITCFQIPCSSLLWYGLLSLWNAAAFTQTCTFSEPPHTSYKRLPFCIWSLFRWERFSWKGPTKIIWSTRLTSWGLTRSSGY